MWHQSAREKRKEIELDKFFRELNWAIWRENLKSFSLRHKFTTNAAIQLLVKLHKIHLAKNLSYVFSSRKGGQFNVFLIEVLCFEQKTVHKHLKSAI